MMSTMAYVGNDDNIVDSDEMLAIRLQVNYIRVFPTDAKLTFPNVNFFFKKKIKKNW